MNDFPFTMQSYRADSDDLAEMIALAARGWTPPRAAWANYHPDDLCWGLKNLAHESRWHLARDRNGVLIGFSEWDAEAGEFEWQPSPEVADDAVVNDAVIRESEAQPLQDAEARTQFASRDDALFISLLERHGYALPS